MRDNFTPSLIFRVSGVLSRGFRVEVREVCRLQRRCALQVRGRRGDRSRVLAAAMELNGAPRQTALWVASYGHGYRGMRLEGRSHLLRPAFLRCATIAHGRNRHTACDTCMGYAAAGLACGVASAGGVHGRNRNTACDTCMGYAAAGLACGVASAGGACAGALAQSG